MFSFLLSLIKCSLRIIFCCCFSSSLAIAGSNYCVIAADTRQSEGYSINSRYAPKAFQLYKNDEIFEAFALIL